MLLANVQGEADQGLEQIGLVEGSLPSTPQSCTTIKFSKSTSQSLGDFSYHQQSEDLYHAGPWELHNHVFPHSMGTDLCKGDCAEGTQEPTRGLTQESQNYLGWRRPPGSEDFAKEKCKKY